MNAPLCFGIGNALHTMDAGLELELGERAAAADTTSARPQEVLLESQA